ncbi:hypothetical protein FHS85_000175 [Rhodoligotrophos appendicifer]
MIKRLIMLALAAWVGKKFLGQGRNERDRITSA